MAAGGPRKPSLVERLERRRERHRLRPAPIRALYVLAGFTVLAAGVAMLVLPGPAFVVIPVGLAMLSLEFAWAEGLLGRALEQAERARRKAAETSARQRALTAIAAAAAIGALAAWAIVGDIPLIPDP